MTMPENQAEALKPYPFCGGVAKLWPPTYAEDNPSEIIGPAFVNCPDCCVAITGTWEDDAAAAWNRRASLPEAPAVPVGMKAREEIIVDISEELKHHDAFDGAAVSQLVWAARIYDKVIAPLLPPQEGAAE